MLGYYLILFPFTFFASFSVIQGEFIFQVALKAQLCYFFFKLERGMSKVTCVFDISANESSNKIHCCVLFAFTHIFQSTTILSYPCVTFWHCYPEGIVNPFNASGCKYLFFVCRYRWHSVAWFSYWFDNLGLINEGNTLPLLCCIIPYSFGKHRRISSDINDRQANRE